MTITAVIALLTLIAAGLAWVELLVRAGELRRVARQQKKTEEKLAAVTSQMTATRHEAAALGKHFETLARQMDKLHERQDQLELRDPQSGVYVQAIRLVRRGADAEQLVADCGLSLGEAQLIVSLHGDGQSSDERE